MKFRETTLGEISEGGSYGLGASSSTDSTGPKFLRTTDIVSGTIDWSNVPYCSADLATIKKYKLFNEDIVISRTGANAGLNCLVIEPPENAIFAGYLVRFQINRDLADARYVSYVLRSSAWKEYVEVTRTGSAQPQFNAVLMSQFPIALPSLNIQKAISALLSAVDSKIAANNALSKTLEDIAKTIFKSWFIDFDPVKAKMAGEKPVGMDAATAVLFPDAMKESELGLIPNGWEVRSLFDCGLEIESGSRPKGGVKGITSGVPSIGAESINGLGVFDFSKTKYVPREFYDKMNRGKPRDFDILLYKDGGKPGEFKPRVGMYGLGFPFSEYGINEHVFILRAQELGNPYLYFWIRLERTLDILRNRGVKAAIPGINQQDVGTIPILRPPKEVLKAFNELAMPSISLILTLASESIKLANLRDTLLPRLISGELQIPEEMLAS